MNNQRKAPTNSRNDTWRFINTRLTNNEKAAISQWVENEGSDLIETLNLVLQEGYKISIKMNVDNELVYATISGNNNTWANNGSSNTSKHTSLEYAIATMLYKHLHLSVNGVWRDDPLDDDWA